MLHACVYMCACMHVCMCTCVCIRAEANTDFTI